MPKFSEMIEPEMRVKSAHGSVVQGKRIKEREHKQDEEAINYQEYQQYLNKQYTNGFLSN